MSFSLELKNEIIENKPFRVRFKVAQAYGFFAFSKSFSEASVEISTENQSALKLFTSFAADILGRDTKIKTAEHALRGTIVYSAKLENSSDRRRLLDYFGHAGDEINATILPTTEHVYAFLSGVYLACGNITDPQKSYHIEFVMRNESLCGALKRILDDVLPIAKKTERRGSHVIYYKELSQIEDLLTMMGASKACLQVIDIEMIKEVRNTANRATNCETANIDKIIDAAHNQIEDIKIVLDNYDEAALPMGLKDIMLLRLENPDISLRELSELSSPKLSRSGIHHRLEKITKLADKYR